MRVNDKVKDNSVLTKGARGSTPNIAVLLVILETLIEVLY